MKKINLKKIFKYIVMFFIIFTVYLVLQPILLNVPNPFTIKNLITPILIFIIYIVFDIYKISWYFYMFFIYFIFYSLALKLNSGGSSFSGILMVVIFSLFITCLICVVNFYIKKFYLRFLINILLVLIVFLPILFYLFYNYNDGVAVTQNIMNAIFQTNQEETKEFFQTYIGIDTYIIFTILFFFIIFLLVKISKNKPDLNLIKISTVMVSVIFIIVIFNIKKLTLYTFLIKSYIVYNQQLEKFEDNIIENSKIKSDKYDYNKSITFVLVIGESLNRNHMSLYGYKRETTPLLDKLEKNNKILVFKHAYANFVATEPSLSYALTNINQLNANKIKKPISIVDYLKEKGFKTFWITNQNIGNDIVSNIARNSDVLVNLNKTKDVSYSQNYDSKVFRHLKRVLNEKIEKKFIIIHLMGSHANYCLRYPHHSEFDKFHGNLDEKQFPYLSKLDNKISSFKDFMKEIREVHSFRDMKLFIKKIIGVSIKRLNCYDNSVLYNDYIVANIIKELNKDEKNKNKILIYFSDHAEDIDHQLAHNPELYNSQMAEIPLIIWVSKQFKEDNNQIVSNLKNNENKLFCNDSIFDTLLGILKYNKCNKNEYHNLACSNYELPKNKAFVLHGKKLFKEDKR